MNMSMRDVIEGIEKDAFAQCMNPPEPYQPTQDDIETIIKLHQIVNSGNSAEVKWTKDGAFVVYDVRKKKR